MIPRYLSLLLLLCLAIGCSQSATMEAPESSVDDSGAPAESKDSSEQGEATDGQRIDSWQSTPVGNEIEPDAEISKLIQPYLESMHATMDEVVGNAAEEITKERPESPLGNLISDALLWYTKKEIDTSAQVALINNGGIRLPSIPKGAVSVGDLYQLVPFDNRIVTLTLTGDQIRALIERLAERGGEPMAGITYRMNRDDDRVSELRIEDEEIIGDRTYTLVTVDYLASIGDEFEILGEAATRTDSTTLLREAVIEYVRNEETISPKQDGRVSYVID